MLPLFRQLDQVGVGCRCSVEVEGCECMWVRIPNGKAEIIRSRNGGSITPYATLLPIW